MSTVNYSALFREIRAARKKTMPDDLGAVERDFYASLNRGDRLIHRDGAWTTENSGPDEEIPPVVHEPVAASLTYRTVESPPESSQGFWANLQGLFRRIFR